MFEESSLAFFSSTQPTAKLDGSECVCVIGVFCLYTGEQPFSATGSRRFSRTRAPSRFHRRGVEGRISKLDAFSNALKRSLRSTCNDPSKTDRSHLVTALAARLLTRERDGGSAVCVDGEDSVGVADSLPSA